MEEGGGSIASRASGGWRRVGTAIGRSGWREVETDILLKGIVPNPPTRVRRGSILIWSFVCCLADCLRGHQLTWLVIMLAAAEAFFILGLTFVGFTCYFSLESVVLVPLRP